MWHYGTTRTGRALTIPNPEHEERLRKTFLSLLRNLAVHPAAHGYVRGRSVVTALSPHIGAAYLAHLDIVGFFPSTSIDMLSRGLLSLGISEWDRDIIFSTCFADGRLPVGSCCSPVLSNIACYRMDECLSWFGTYTRYSDQLLISSKRPINEGGIRECVRYNGYRVNERKSLLLVRGRTPMVVMGYQIGELSLTRSRKARRRERARKHKEEVKGEQ